MDKHYIKLSLILGALAALGPLCIDLYLPALPQITQQMNSSTSLSQLTLTAALLGLGFGQLFFGPLSDKIGRKTPLIISLLTFIAASVICSFATSIEQLIVARFIQGLAGSGGIVLSRTIARDHFDGPALTHFFVILMSINNVAPIFAPVAGSFQLTYTQWPGLFISLAFIAGFILLASLFSLKESHQPSNEQSISMLKAIKVTLSERKFVGMCLAQGLMLAGMFAYIGASSYVFQESYGLSPQTYSYIFALNGFGLIVSAFIASKISYKQGEINVINIGLVLAVANALVLLVSGLLHAPLWIIIIELFITIAFTSAMSALINSQAMQLSDKHAGAASACLGTLMFVLGGVSAPLTGIGGTSLFNMSLVLTACYFGAMLSWFFITEPKKVRLHHAQKAR